MKNFKKSLLIASLAFAGVSASMSGVAQASYNINATNSLYLGFYSLDPAKDSSVVINIGSPGLVFGGHSFDMGGASSALSLAFGPDWYSNTNTAVQWSVFGRIEPTTGANTAAYFGTASENESIITGSGGATSMNAAKYTPLNGRMSTVLSDAVGVNATLSTVTNSLGNILEISTVGNSLSSFSNFGEDNWGGAFSTPVVISVTDGLNIQGWTKSGTTYIDQTTFGGVSQVNGVISVVPEPSTYALIGFGSLLLLIAYRRRSA